MHDQEIKHPQALAFFASSLMSGPTKCKCAALAELLVPTIVDDVELGPATGISTSMGSAFTGAALPR